MQPGIRLGLQLGLLAHVCPAFLDQLRSYICANYLSCGITECTFLVLFLLLVLKIWLLGATWIFLAGRSKMKKINLEAKKLIFRQTLE